MIGPNALSIELIKPTGERSTANLVPRSSWGCSFNCEDHIYFHIFICSSKYDSFYIFQSMRDGCIRRLLATHDFSEMKIFSAIEIAWISDDYFESFPPLTEGVKTTWSNRLTFRLWLRPIMYMNRSKVKRKDKKAASIRAQLIKLLQV